MCVRPPSPRRSPGREPARPPAMPCAQPQKTYRHNNEETKDMKTLQRLKASPPNTSRLALLALASTLCTAAFATEGRGSTYPLGTENFVAGAAPPPRPDVLGGGHDYTPP